MDFLPQTPQEPSSDKYELMRMKLAYVEGRPRELRTNETFLLNEPDTVWFVHSGQIDIFFVEMTDGEPSGARNFLFRANEGDLLLGMDHSDSSIGLLASSLPQAKIIRLSQQQTWRLTEDEDFRPFVTDMIDRWIRLITGGLNEGVSIPRQYQRMQPGETLTLEQGDAIRPSSRRDVMWLRTKDDAALALMNQTSLIIGMQGQWLPLSGMVWSTVINPGRIDVTDTWTALHDDSEWTSLRSFHRFLLQYLDRFLDAQQQREREQYRTQAAFDQTRLQNTFQGLAATLNAEQVGPPIPTTADDPMLQACQLVAEVQRITIRRPPDNENSNMLASGYSLRDIALASRVRYRQVALRGMWWKKDNGPLIGYYDDSQQPIALLPDSPSSYILIDPVTQERRPVDHELAQQVYFFGHILYRPLPSKGLSALGLLRFGVASVKRELRTVFLLGIIIGLLQIAVPVVTGFVFDDLIPRGDSGQIIRIGMLLLAIAISGILLQMAQLFAFMRVETRLDSDLQSGIWDRLISLPISFFQGYSAGDLGNNAMGVTHIRRMLSLSVTNAIISGIFSVFNLALLFTYSGSLALVALVLVIISFVATTGLGYIYIRRYRKVDQGKLSGIVLQFINGIAKFRVAGVERRAFTVWAAKFGEQRQYMYDATQVQNSMSVFAQAYPIIALMVIFGMIAYSGTTSLSVGSFLAFNTAFSQFLASSLELSVAIITVLGAVPLYERLRPIIQAEPEIDDDRTPPGDLSGAIEVTNATFRYANDGPLVLNNVTIKINPGEFVALVGPSGSGKSTIFRLLLGFETLSSGTILYDGQDLNKLDVRAVRRQIGVVLQNGQLMSGSDIYTNIIGAHQLSMDDAWEAARMAGFEEDVRQMPMGMNTVVSEGGSTLSGGQRQRLMIARAIVTRPRILLFDEATSALDNRTQAIVSESLERLDATRVVIAHRLSTIINADRIIVLRHGEVVEEGTYDELMQQGGAFVELARRQII